MLGSIEILDVIQYKSIESLTVGSYTYEQVTGQYHNQYFWSSDEHKIYMYDNGTEVSGDFNYGNPDPTGFSKTRTLSVIGSSGYDIFKMENANRSVSTGNLILSMGSGEDLLLKAKLKNHTPLQLLEKKYPSVHDKDQYARILWHQFPPMASHPPWMRADLPGKQEESLTAEDVIVMHLATISFSATSMVCEPTIDKIMKLVDEILTDGFVTDTEPLLLDVSPTHLEAASIHTNEIIPPWGDAVNGQPSLRVFSLCHHKSASRVVALHVLLNVFMEEPQHIDIG